MLLALLFLLLPTQIASHGCPAFIVTEDQTILDTGFVPSSFRTFVEQHSNKTSVFTGVYDCHLDQEGYEVAVSAICQGSVIIKDGADGDDQCICQALYQFQECNSCTICSAGGQLSLESFTADCSNVLVEKNCTVQCGFVTNDCYPEDVNTANTSSGSEFKISLLLVLLSALAAIRLTL